MGDTALAAQAATLNGEHDAMKWVRRGLWMAAWGFWLWLGIGLARELPRSPRCIAELSFSEHERPLGFVDGDGLLATERWAQNESGGEARCSVWEVASGVRRHDLDWPLLWTRELFAPKHGVVIGNRRKAGAKQGELTLFDLRTGEWRPLGPESWRVEAVHPEQPWAAIDERPDDGEAEKVLVLDFRTGARIFEWTKLPSVKVQVYVQDCQFLGGDELLITAFNFLETRPARVRWDVYHFSLSRGELARMSFEREHCGVKLPMQGGRLVLFGPLDGEGMVRVLEFPSGRVVFSSAELPANQRAASTNEWKSTPTLSPSGRRLMTVHPTLWDVDDGRQVWRLGPTDVGIERQASPGLFSVEEDWQPLINLVWPSWEIHPATTAVRDIETGALRYRLWGDDLQVCTSSDGKMATGKLGLVYALPVGPNYPLLALCQAILALPLVLLWAIMRWRRKRRLRLASATP